MGIWQQGGVDGRNSVVHEVQQDFKHVIDPDGIRGLSMEEAAKDRANFQFDYWYEKDQYVGQ